MVFCGTALAANISKVSFTADDPDALVLVEERDGLRGGSLTFVRVDLGSMTRGSARLVVDKTTKGRLRTSDPGLQTKGEGLLIPKNMSRFSAAKGSAGDYALTGFEWYNGIGSRRACPPDGVPVFRFAAGKANLVTTEMLPAGGSSSNILRYAAARNGSNDDVADAQKILNESRNLRGTVVPAELIGYVKFRNDRGKASGCSNGKMLVLVKSGK